MHGRTCPTLFWLSCHRPDGIKGAQLFRKFRPLKYAMNKKEIESPKLTANFLVWIGLFVLLLAAVAHFVLKAF